MADLNDIAVAIVAHVSHEALSDGNTKTRVEGRLRLLKLVLRSLFLFNDMDKCHLSIFDTGDFPEDRLLDALAPYGFGSLIQSSSVGFNVNDLPGESRVYLRYRRPDKWQKDFQARSRRFLESCEAALKHAAAIGKRHLLILEGDTVVFGRNYVPLLTSHLEDKAAGFVSSCEEVYTDLWVSNVADVLDRFGEVYHAFERTRAVEGAFAAVFPDRVDLAEIVTGHKSLDQQVVAQRSIKRLRRRYYRRHVYSWITHFSEPDIVDVEKYLKACETLGPDAAGKWLWWCQFKHGLRFKKA